ncbi:Transcription factor RLM1 [Cyphellophora attinorum]|uniref:Transcription factor RLM1 n=1 Tax=Cyphellophora attinorum TaxID=1664694 RepID=A0A0N1HAR6_9EURO|nr:Transcription factor RLM1 [Phialophora attinorum]KPI45226.1 Transcription factor RLM1 [Phialophora attinorum]
MGRRKIEIRAIKDDRNRSVTFLKRKGGLFKKAHELSVLCSVDVAVIIFGHNKKLYEFSSGDIHETLRRYSYYGQPHEHKGPADFKGKGGGSDDEDDDEDDGQQIKEDSLPPQQHPGMMPPHMQHHNSFQHIRPPHQASASPPMQNGMFPRHSTPQPPQIDSRPGSRNTIRRTSSNLVPMQHPHPTPPPPQNGFAYMPNPPIYQPQQNMPTTQPQFQQFPPQHQQPQQYLHPQQGHPPPRPASAPRHDSLGPPQHMQQRQSPQPEFKQPQNTPPQIKHLSSKSRSIFTPIDEGGSVLAQHFFGGGAPDPPRQSTMKRSVSPQPPPRSTTTQPQMMTTSAFHQQPQPPPRPQSTSNAPEFPPPTRSNTSGSRSGAPRPKLNLTIPSEASDNEDEATGAPNQPRPAVAPRSANPAAGGSNSTSNSSGRGIVHLPPPSPSASAVLSAGAVGPGNPFARPHPPAPTSQNKDAYDSNATKNGGNGGPVSKGSGDSNSRLGLGEIETPISHCRRDT